MKRIRKAEFPLESEFASNLKYGLKTINIFVKMIHIVLFLEEGFNETQLTGVK